ncbi:MAG TPA: DHH family phosphoesterase [Feifaniaceae bacterium]|nr:DHH family phosphoesterase [Feifaniaceae bacterium]
MKRPPQRVLVPIAILCAIMGIVIGYFDIRAGVASIVVSLIVLLISLRTLGTEANRQRQAMDTVFSENATAAGRLIAEVNIPCMIFEKSGRIIWRNAAMKKLYDGVDLKPLPAACNPKAGAQSGTMEYAGSSYQVTTTPVFREHASRELLFQYWVNRTEAEHYRRLYEEQMPYVALIYVDNYEELSADLQFRRNAVLTEVERLIADTTISIQGIYRRYDNGRFLLVFEANYLKELEKDRFSILEKAHKIDTGTSQSVTLSIAVGAAPRVAQADIAARQGMELALGRGGDQAVVRQGANYTFYGGRRQLESGQSRVKTRLFAKAFRQLLENSTEAFIMGHRQPDMDCIGAALGVYRCVAQAGCKAYIVLDQVNPTIQQAVDSIRTNPAYADVIVSSERVREMMRASSVLVVVDTQRAKATIEPPLVEMAGKLVLIDHHRRSTDYIDNATLNHLDARASSTSEMVTETIQYFHEGIRPTAFECSALLAGITVDTKHFAFNVGARTFEAAAYLRQHGADIGTVKLMFQDDRETYANRVDIVKSANIICPGVALAVCPPEIKNAGLIAAQAADALVGIRGIEAAFVLGVQNGEISVSGRSLGRINVQLVLERIGGGGHLTMAGAQLRDMTLEAAVELVKSTAIAYIKELDG